MISSLFNTLPIWFGLLAGGVVVLQIISGISKRLRRARAMEGAMLTRVQHARRVMREKAVVTLGLRREEMQQHRELAMLQEMIEDGETAARQEKGNDSQIYVFDERKNLGDQAFMLTISHPDFSNLARKAPEEVVQSWRSGRRYMVWAASEKMAGAKAGMRFNQDKGYRVSEPVPFQGDAEAF
ncbi:hypothetical protein GE253_09010 [Niveispirillum sp. SYP-B3756]|uniref:hypothetical protein n=1 Tax=Niveispirillum sp. SYP-B3756 TaxID=2662178 RepID=UPI001290CB73|nr:hypothetical protein [Niveispirillum sp. SYP-B3756]MQP65489.1 hypothetical protein [Niveispirillum sp. SYP-B3756]